MTGDDVRTMRTAFIFLTLTAAFFGGTWVAGKVAVVSIPPITLAAARFALASALLWLWARTKQPAGRRPAVAPSGQITTRRLGSSP